MSNLIPSTIVNTYCNNPSIQNYPRFGSHPSRGSSSTNPNPFGLNCPVTLRSIKRHDQKVPSRTESHGSQSIRQAPIKPGQRKYTKPVFSFTNCYLNSLNALSRPSQLKTSLPPITYAHLPESAIGEPGINQLEGVNKPVTTVHSTHSINQITPNNINGIEIEHVKICQIENEITIQTKIFSKIHYSNLQLFNPSLVYDHRVSLLDLTCNKEDVVVTETDSSQDDFYKTGLIATLDLQTYTTTTITYRLKFNFGGNYTDRLVLQLNSSDKYMDENESAITSTLDLTINYRPKKHLFESKKIGIEYRLYGKEIQLNNDNDNDNDNDQDDNRMDPWMGPKIALSNWKVKNDKHPNVFIGVDFKLESTSYKIDKITGLTANNTVVPLEVIGSYDQSVFGHIKCPIGREFDSRKMINNNKANYVVRLIVFHLRPLPKKPIVDLDLSP